MKRTLILIILIFCIFLTIHSREYLIKQVIPDAGYNEIIRQQHSVKILHLGNRYPFLSIPTLSSSSLYRTRFYHFTGDSFAFQTDIDSLRITDIGDFDNDGLPELLGYSIANDNKFAVMEQPDTNQIYSIRTWESDSMYHGMSHLASTNLIKTDGADKIFGATPQNSNDGFFYMTSNGDDSYDFDYELIEDRTCYSMGIGYLDDDSLVDIIAGTGKGQTWWEATDSNQDSFTMIKPSMEGGIGTHYTVLMDDIDKDGLNEFIKGGLMYLTSPCMWGISIVEWKQDTICEMIFRDTISKDYGFLENFYSGSDVDYGDVDGDGEDEIIVCAGCILRVYEIAGNDSFVQVWQMDNDTFSGSHVRVYDFNENGIDEIIWSGQSDPDLPLTSGINVKKTYIIENTPISKLTYDSPYDLGNKPLNTTVLDSVYLYSSDELPVVIDSMNLVNSNELTLSSITYPCTIPSYDSLPFELSVYSDSAGYITDTLLIYSNDQNNTLDTMEIHSGTGVSLILDSAVASDNRNAQTGIDYDDCVILYFNYPVDTNTVSPSYLDSILPLSNNHTWCDGTGSIDRINYLEDNTVMIVWFSTDSILPTVQVGDTIKPDSITIQDRHHYSYLTDNTIITGSFGPTGINSYPTIDHQPSTIDLTFNSIQIENNTNNIHTYQITDITGRVINNIEAKKGKTKYTPHRSGIYFILDNKNRVLGKSIIVR